MANINYILSITGDCFQTGVGKISIYPDGETAPYVVQWLEPDLGSDYINTGETSSRENLYTGNYSIQIIDSSTPNQSVPVLAYVPSQTCCNVDSVSSTTCGLNNGVVNLSTNSNILTNNFYIYDSNDSLVSSSTTATQTYIYDSLSGGTYYAIIQNESGCSGRSETFLIEETVPLDFGLWVVPNSSCGLTNLGKIYITGITGSPPYTYTWSNGETGNTITGLTTGAYSVNVVDNLGCSVTKDAIIEDVGLLGVANVTLVQPTCLSNDGSITLELTGGTLPFYYSASTGDFQISYSRTLTYSGLSSGTYQYNITDAALCRVTTTTNLQQPGGIYSVSVLAMNSSCSNSDGSITVSLNGSNGPFTYTLIYPDSSSSVVTVASDLYIFSNLYSGTYSVAVSDTVGCSYMEEIILITEDKFTIDVQTSATTFGQSNGIIEIIMSEGGDSPFNYIIDNITVLTNTVLTAFTFTNISSGEHVVSVIDSLGCTQTKNVYVDSVDPVVFNFISSEKVSENEGQITALITSGVPPFQFYWSDNISGNPQTITVTGLTADTYSLTIIDSNNSSYNRSVTLTGNKNYVSYETFTMDSNSFDVQKETKFGLLEMLNDGYQELISENSGCELVSATFTAKVSVIPVGIEVSEVFFTTTSLIIAPTDNLWYDSLRQLLLGIIGIDEVIIDDIDNKITILSNKNNTNLTYENIKADLVIDYDIKCSS